MRLISPKEYAKLTGLSVGYVYDLVRQKKLPVVPHQMTVKRIPWDDENKEPCQAELVAA